MASFEEIKARIVGSQADRALIEQVLAAVGVTAAVGGSWGPCPLCKKKTDQTFKVNDNGTCRCQKCDRARNVLDLVMEIRQVDVINAIGFVGDAVGMPLDRKYHPDGPAKAAKPQAPEAYAAPRRTLPVPAGEPVRSFVAADGGEIKVFAAEEGMKAELPSRLSAKAGEKAVVDRGYRILLKHLVLKREHRRWLAAKRGFGDALIDRRLYRSLPKVADMPVAIDAAVMEMGVEVAAALPGLVVQEVGGKPRWMLAARYSGNGEDGFPKHGETGDGLVTPVMGADGMVLGLRVRLHSGSNVVGWAKKVVWLSSGYCGGAGPGAPFHHAFPTVPADAATVVVTEGEDKAQAAAEHLGCLALSLPGLNHSAGQAIVRQLDALIDAGGGRFPIGSVRMATDMDPPGNVNAARDAAHAITAVREFAAARGLEISVGRWDGDKAKGIDDAISAGLEIEWLRDAAIDAHLEALLGRGELDGEAALPEALAIPEGDDDGGGDDWDHAARAAAPIIGREPAPAAAPGAEEVAPREAQGQDELFPDGAQERPPRLADMEVEGGLRGAAGGPRRLLDRAQMASRPGLPDVAFELLAPDRFKVGPAGISVDGGEKGPKPVTIDPIVPLSVSRCLDTGEEEVVFLHWRRGTPGEWAVLRMEASALASRSELGKQAAHGLEVNLQNGGELSLYLSEAIRLNAHLLPTSLSSSRMGMLEIGGKWRCLLGRRCISAEGVTEGGTAGMAPDALAGSLVFKPGGAGEAALEGVFSTKGTIDGQRDLISLVAGLPKCRVIMYAGLVAPILVIASKPGFILDVYAPNSSSKSTLTRLCASQYGRTDDSGGHPGQEMPWSSTPAALELRSGTMSGLPTFVDDTKHLVSHGGGQKASDMAYTVGGGGRLRAEMGGAGTRAKKIQRTLMVTSGEVALVSLLPPTDGGAVMRILELGHPVPLQSRAMAAVADRIKVGVHRHFGHIGTAWIEFLLRTLEEYDRDNGQGAFAKLLNEAIDAEVARLAAKAPGHPSASRLAGYAAAINLVAGMASLCKVKLQDGTEATLYPWDEELVDDGEYPADCRPPAGMPLGRAIDGEIWAGMLEHAQDSSGEMKALDSVHAWAVAHQGQFDGRFDPAEDRPREVLGSWREDTRDKPWAALYILQPALEQYLRQQGFVPSQVLSAWREKGITKCDPGRMSTKSVKIGGEYPRVVAIKREALVAAERGPAQLDLGVDRGGRG